LDDERQQLHHALYVTNYTSDKPLTESYTKMSEGNAVRFVTHKSQLQLKRGVNNSNYMLIHIQVWVSA